MKIHEGDFECCEACGLVRLASKMVEEKEITDYHSIPYEKKYTYYCVDCVSSSLKESSYIKEQIDNIKNHGTRHYYD